MIHIIIILLLVSISAVAKAIMDTLQFHYSKSIFEAHNDNYWDASISWVRKYSDVERRIRKKWFNLIPIPVLFTDGWYLFQSIFLTSLFLVIGLHTPVINWIVDFLILRVFFGIIFYVFYTYILIKNN